MSYEHLVQFYEQEDFLLAEVSTFLGDGLRAGSAGLVIATPQHRAPLEQRLEGHTSHDAAAMLSVFMVDGWPDEHLFHAMLGSVIDRASQGGTRQVRIFGEMASLLWAQGGRASVFRLEELWNNLAMSHSFSLFCTHPLGNFRAAEHRGSFLRICHSHSRVSPAESYSKNADPKDRHRQVALLQQQAGALDAETEKRMHLERMLRAIGYELRTPQSAATFSAELVRLRGNAPEEFLRTWLEPAGSTSWLAKEILPLILPGNDCPKRE